MRNFLLVILFFITTLTASNAQKQFWGTASAGGEHNNGFIFRTDSIGDNLEIVHHFESAVDGENIGRLLLASNHKLYGLAGSGGNAAAGVFSGGTFYEYDLETDRFRVIQHFGPSNTDLPNTFLPKAEGLQGLTEVSPGVLYGLMRQGQSVFSYNMNTGAVGQPFTLPTYQGGPTNSTLTNRIAESFYKAADGYFYAATYTNSSCPVPNPNMGSILRLQVATNTLTVRHKNSCVFENGFSYNGHFAEVSGKLYSTTLSGGTSGKGVIYEYNPTANTYTKRHDFTGSVYGYDANSLIVAKNGKLYGTAYGGGIPEANLPAGGGVLYEFDLNTNTFTKKYDFELGVSWLGGMGSFPRSLVSSTNSKVYGTTQFGVFEFNPATNEMRMAGRFWTLGFDPSIVQVCRKPSYQFQSVSTYPLCAGAAFSLDFASTNATSVTWKHNDVVEASHTTPQLTLSSFTAEDAGTWTCTMTNECGTTVTQAITLQLNEPAPPTIATTGALTFCAGESVTLSAPEGFGGYTWSTGETSREIVVTESGDYTVSVNNGCESPASNPTTVIIHELPDAPVAIEVPSFNRLKATGASDLYEWTRDGVVLDVHTAEIEVTASGTYNVRSVSSEGCRSAGFATIVFVLTDAESGAENEITIYPNPTHGRVHIVVGNSMRGKANVSLFHSTGRVVFTKTINFQAEESSIDPGDLSAGVYHLMIRVGEKVVLKKVVVR